MATTKSFTDISQSRKLAEILPLESADMEYMFLKKDGSKVSNVPFVKDGFEEPECCYIFIPCWSLAALLSILPVLGNKHAVFGTSIKESKWHILYHNIDTLFLEDSGLYDNLVDACVNMIEKLHELSLL